jgi:hypothetical protein
MKEMVFEIELLKKTKKFKKKKLDIYDMNKYAWMMKKDQVAIEERTDPNKKSKANLKKAGELLFNEVVRNSNEGPGLVYFDSLKVELQKRGFIQCKFGRLDVVLHNMKSDAIVSTYGFNSLKIKKILSLGFSFLTSNIELVSTMIITLTLAFFGGVSNFVILGFIFFCIIIEEQLGFSKFWKVVYMFSLLKLVLKSTLNDSYPGPMQLIFGNPVLIPDIIIMVLLNVVLYI